MHPTDALSSPTLKHVREEWWNDDFTEFLQETLRPRPGNRILDVGCRRGVAEVAIGRLHLSQVRLCGVDLRLDHVRDAKHEAESHNIRVAFAVGDACRLPFADGSFDSTFGVAVLQHIHDVDEAVRELARVTRTGGRIVAVEPDNAARYAYSSAPSGALAFSLAAAFFAAAAAARGDTLDLAVGPRLPERFAASGIDPVMVRLFPVSYPRLGAPSEEVWRERREAVARVLVGATEAVRVLGQRYLAALDLYERESRASSGVFVEIQNTMLFATVGQRQ